MIQKIKAFLEGILASKVGNGFAFLLYMAMCFALGLILKASYELIAASLFAGLGVQTGQRTYTQVKLTKAGYPSPPEEVGGKKDPLT